MKPAAEAILIALSQQDGEERTILAELYSRLAARPGWTAYLIDPGRLKTDAVRRMNLVALVGRIEPAIANELAGDLPVVTTVCGQFDEAAVVITDNTAVGETAAEHLMSRGFKSFAYAGSGRRASQLRRTAFTDRLTKAGHTVESYIGPNTGAAPWSPTVVHRELNHWIRELPTGTALLAENDLVGFRISEICRHHHIAIPDQLSLIGFGNDDLMCRLCHPPLTTIATHTKQIGGTIVEVLDKLLANQRLDTRTITLPHAGIVERQSAGTIRTDDTEVADALRYIRARAQSPLSIDEIVTAVVTSRRTLERRFRRVTGHSLQAAITQARVDRAKGLLAYSRSSLQAVAQISGFSTVQRFHIVFRRTTGTTPQAYRLQFQSAGLEKSSSRA